MVLRIKQKVVNHLRKCLNFNQINNKSIKTKPIESKINESNDCFEPKFFIDLNDFNDNFNENDLKNSLSKVCPKNC